MGNSADESGGILNYGGSTLTVINTAILSNTVYDKGGGIENLGLLALTNTTVAGNSAGSGGGLYNYDDTRTTTGTATLASTTFANNSATASGGDIYSGVGSFVTVVNSIAASGTAAGSPNNCNTTLTTQGYNLDDGNTCGFSAATDLRNTNPRLDSQPRNNGGPTMTLALLTGSPAINHGPAAGNPNCPMTDQRGYARSVGTRCDIGAYEYGAHALRVRAGVQPPRSSGIASGVGLTVAWPPPGRMQEDRRGHAPILLRGLYPLRTIHARAART
jgi:predicted outer membrane repeat protein